MITIDQLASICQAAPRDTLQGFIAPLNDIFSEPAWGLQSKARQAVFLAQAAHESQQLTRLEENLKYTTVERLRKVFPRYFKSDADALGYVGYPRKIANRVYGGRMGNEPEPSDDGFNYRGRGIFMNTGKDNYRAISRAICGDPDVLLTNPELLSDPDYAVLAAAHYWITNKLGPLADQGRFDAVCDLVNLGRITPAEGDSIGYQDRLKYWRLAQAALNP